MNKKITKNQALLVAIGMMIGSGIFFRADDIITATQGNTLVAILAWVFISVTLIFAGVTVSGVASQTNGDGGFIAYIEDHFSRIFGEKVGRISGFVVGWYQIIIYAPIMVAVVSIVFGSYVQQLFGYSGGWDRYQTFLLGFVILTGIFVWNSLSTKIAALISVTATYIKVIPLIVLAVSGLIFGDPSGLSGSALDITMYVSDAPSLSTFGLFLAPMLSMAFAFDGWISVGSLSRDVIEPKTNLPKVFTFSIIVTAVIYILYFIGINSLMSPLDIIANGDAHVGIIANDLFGSFGEKLVLTAVTVSVLGTANALYMACARYTHRLATDKLLVGSKVLEKVTKNNVVIYANIYSFVIAGIYIALYATQSLNDTLSGIAFDDIPMMLNSVFYLIVFAIAFNLFLKKSNSLFKGVIAPIIASVGQVLIVVAFFLTNENALTYLLISIVVILIGFVNFAFNKKG